MRWEWCGLDDREADGREVDDGFLRFYVTAEIFAKESGNQESIVKAITSSLTFGAFEVVQRILYVFWFRRKYGLEHCDPRQVKHLMTNSIKDEQNPDVQIVGVQPVDGSRIPGIRRWSPEFLPKIYDPERVDWIIDVSSEDSRNMMRRLAKEEGIFFASKRQRENFQN